MSASEVFAKILMDSMAQGQQRDLANKEMDQREKLSRQSAADAKADRDKVIAAGLKELELRSQLEAKAREESQAFTAAQAEKALNAQKEQAEQNRIMDYITPFDGDTQSALLEALGKNTDNRSWIERVADLTKGKTVAINPGDAGYVTPEPRVAEAPKPTFQEVFNQVTPTPWDTAPLAVSMPGPVETPETAAIGNAQPLLPQNIVVPGLKLRTKADRDAEMFATKQKSVSRTQVAKMMESLQSKQMMDNMISNPGVKFTYLQTLNEYRVDAGLEPVNLDDFDKLVLGPQAQATLDNTKQRTKQIADKMVNDAAYWTAEFNEKKRHNIVDEGQGQSRINETSSYHDFLVRKAELDATAKFQEGQYKPEEIIKGYQYLKLSPNATKETKAAADAGIARVTELANNQANPAPAPSKQGFRKGNASASTSAPLAQLRSEVAQIRAAYPTATQDQIAKYMARRHNGRPEDYAGVASGRK